jgi:hypothetical protein
VTDSPSSSAPSTPNDESQGHRRAGTVAIGSEDYFVSALRLRQDTKSAPGTPRGSMKRNATFSPRIVFFETWPSQEYDRRGDIATCNRLTPMLAQQIKEELNSFKMVGLPAEHARLLMEANSRCRRWRFTRTRRFIHTSFDDRAMMPSYISWIASFPYRGGKTPSCICPGFTFSRRYRVSIVRCRGVLASISAAFASRTGQRSKI